MVNTLACKGTTGPASKGVILVLLPLPWTVWLLPWLVGYFLPSLEALRDSLPATGCWPEVITTL